MLGFFTGLVNENTLNIVGSVLQNNLQPTCFCGRSWADKERQELPGHRVRVPRLREAPGDQRQAVQPPVRGPGG